MTTAALGATQTGDVLLAFVASDGPSGAQTATVCGGGLTWSLVRRANTRSGTSEIWRAVAPGSASAIDRDLDAVAAAATTSRCTVIAFAGAGGVGASSGAGAATGAPKATLTTTGAGSWVFGVGNDWDGATARTLGAGQTLRHQWVDTGIGDTFWVQSQTSPTPAAGTAVAIDDTAPTTDQWNLAAVEVLPGSRRRRRPTRRRRRSRMSDPSAATTVSGIVAARRDRVRQRRRDQRAVQGRRPAGRRAGHRAAVPGPWDTRTASAGPHTLTAEASDAAGNAGTPPGVIVTVDNSAPPPATIAIDRLWSGTPRARSRRPR